jgi:hypothetical protein
VSGGTWRICGGLGWRRGYYGHMNAMGGHCRGVFGIGIGRGPGPSATAFGSAFGLSKMARVVDVADTQVPTCGRQARPHIVAWAPAHPRPFVASRSCRTVVRICLGRACDQAETGYRDTA